MRGTTIFSLRPYLAPHRARLAQIALWGLLLVIPALFTGLLIARSVDAAISGKPSDAAAYLLGLAVVGSIGAWALLVFARRTAGFIEMLRQELTSDVVHNTMVRIVHGGEIGVSGVEATGHVPSVLQYLAMILRTIPAWLVGLGSTVGIATISPGVLLRILPWLALGTAALVAFVAWQPRFARRLVIADEAWYSEAVKSLSAVRDLLATRSTDYQVARLEKLRDAAAAAAINQVDMFALGQYIVIALLQVMPLAATLLALPDLLRDGSLSQGDVLGTMTYLFAGLGAAATVVGNWTAQIVGMRVATSRLRDAWVDEAAFDLEADVSGTTPTNTTVALSSVSFSYGGHARRIFNSFDLVIPPGDHIAIVGPSGIGKSTLAAIIGGILRPDSGSVRVGEAEIYGHPRRPDMVAMIPQDSYVFDGSLRENLCYLVKDATDTDILFSADAIGLGPVVERVGGLDGEIDLAKSGLSSGEQQLIALTRVHLAGTPIVVLDEATCHLDPAAEETAERAFMNGNQTLIVVAHRMSATLRARRVLVIDTETHIGTHDELLKTSSLYHEFHSEWERAQSMRAAGRSD